LKNRYTYRQRREGPSASAQILFAIALLLGMVSFKPRQLRRRRANRFNLVRSVYPLKRLSERRRRGLEMDIRDWLLS